MKNQIQKFGRNLTAMIMPNIGAFIAWGLITAFFIPTGWIPNETLSSLVGPMILNLLPLLIAYSGGMLVGKTRGAVIGTVATMGLIVGSSIPMFLGAMIMGPLAAYILKLFDDAIEGKVPAGFEMLVNNFSLGIIGGAIALLNVWLVGGFIEGISNVLGSAVEGIVNAKLLPLVSIVVEPAKILFLNNAINHGVFTPLGAQQAEAAGKSILYLVETNPGPGLGIILAYMFHTRGKIQNSTYGASIIHFLGGIHEIYFPYVLMKPRLIIAVILGGMTGVTVNTIFGNGLVGPPSPGSVFALSLLSTKGVGILLTLLSIAASALVSYLLAAVLLKSSKSDFSDADLGEATLGMQAMKGESKGKKSYAQVNSIAFACDAGMGSSAAGATLLKNKLKEAGLNISVEHASFTDVSDKYDLILTQDNFVKSVSENAPSAIVVAVSNFMDATTYDNVVNNLKSAKK